MKIRNVEILLAAAIFSRSISFVMNKIGMNSMAPFNILGVRFLLAFLIMVAVFHKRIIHINSRALISGITIGTIFFTIMSTEMFSLKYINSSTEAFLENSAIVWVPVMEAFLCIFTKKRRRIPGVTAIISAGFTLTGVGFLTLNGGLSKFGFGEFLGISSGLLYAVGIIIIDRMTKIDDALLIGIIQLGVMGALSIISSFIFESPTLPSSGTEWFIILVLAVVCSSFGFAFQTYAQKFVSSERTGIFVALNPLGAAIFGALILHEIFGIVGTAGSLFILTGIVIHSRAGK